MLNVISIRYQNHLWASLLAIMLFCVVPMSVLAQQQEKWTLEDSIRRAVQIAPEIRGAQAGVNARRGALEQAGAWPNPQIELRVDNKMGKDQGSGGSDFTQLSFNQPLPLSGRLGHQQTIAGANLDAARAERSYQRLNLETQVAQRFHVLQLATEQMQLAEQRLNLAENLQGVGHRRAQVGEISKLERLRLDLIRESAQQTLDKSEGAYNEALNRFRVYLNISSDTIPRLPPLDPFGAITSLEMLQSDLPHHPLLTAAQYKVEANRSAVNLAKAERLPDPTLRLFYEQDVLNGRQQAVSGIGLGITVPLWDRKSGRIDEAQAQIIETQSELQILARDLGSRLQQSHLHLNHLIKQGEHYRTQVLEPAQEVLELTTKAYTSGELEILSLIDANNTFFDARERYLELQQQAWLEAAEVRLAAGQTLVITEQDTLHE
jgi:cobalt-zinc-cadmium efflux system outer membrane protein